MNKRFVEHEDATVKNFRDDPDFAAEYLSAVLENGDSQETMLAWRGVH